MTDAIEQVAPVDIGTDQAADAPLSVMEHAAEFSPAARAEHAGETPEEKADREHHSAQQRRDRANGQFRDGKVRHRAQSAQASPEDVPRIKALTAARKTAEERVTALEAEVTRLKSAHAPAAQVAQAETRVEQAKPAAEPTRQPAKDDDPEPTETDAKYAGDYGLFLKDQARWAARDENRAIQRRQTEADTKAKQQQSQETTLKNFAGRVQAAKGKYQDFEQVAFGPTRIPAGSAIDAFIMEDDAGAEMLYYLNAPSHTEEMDSLLGLSALAQAKYLSQLSLRLLPSQSTQAGTTGSAAGPTRIVLPPKPPNPVRTEAQRTGASSPPTDGTLSVMGHAKAFRRG